MNREMIYKTRLLAILQITQAINSNFSREQLLRIYESILKNLLKPDKLVVFSTRNGLAKQLELIHGLEPEQVFELNLPPFLERIQDTEVMALGDSFSDFFQWLIPVFHKNKPLAFVLLSAEENPLDSDDLDFIQALTNIIYVAFENKILAKESIRQESLKKELELASTLQNLLLPQTFPISGAVEVNAFYKTHSQVGGDYYDYFKLDDGTYAVCIADVSGKGISAALLMSNFQANVRALFPYVSNLEDLANILNQKVMLAANGEKFITAFLGKFCPDSRTLTYINCGHNPPLYFQNKNILTLKEGSIGLGMLDELPFTRSGKIETTPESTLVLYTDGLTEVEGPDGKYLGLDGFRDFLSTVIQNSTQDLITRTIVHIRNFSGKEEHSDDMAFLVLRFH